MNAFHGDTPMSEPTQKKQGRNLDSQRHADVPPVPAEEMVEIGSEQHPDVADDHSERESGGDQDIDTAGQVPGNKATGV